MMATKKSAKAKKSAKSKKSTETEISRSWKDILQKAMQGLYSNGMLKYLGIDAPDVQLSPNPEFPVIKVTRTQSDFLLFTCENFIFHLEFITQFTKKSIEDIAMLDLMLYQKYGKEIHTVAICAYGAGKILLKLRAGCVEVTLDVINLGDYDGDSILEEIERKLRENEELTDEDAIALTLVPLMRSLLEPYKRAEKIIELAKSIPDEEKQNACLAGAISFAGMYVDEDSQKKLLEMIKMTSLAELLIMDATNEKARTIAKTQLIAGADAEFIARTTGLDIDVVNKLKAEVEKTKQTAS
jgi:hypothetical protein